MSPFTLFAIYFIFWWLTLFMTLPFGMRSQADEGEIVPGTEPGAPANPQLGRRLIINTIVSSVFFAIFCFVVLYLDFGIDDIPMIIDVK